MPETIENESTKASVKTFVWHEIYVASVDKAVHFYGDVLGLGSTSMDMGPGVSYTMLTRDGAPVCGVVSLDMVPMPNVPPHWAVYMGVDDVDAKVASAVKNGGTEVMPPMDIPTVGRMALIQDSQGAYIRFFKGEPSEMDASMAAASGQTFVWHELYVPSVAKAVDFYHSVLGMGSTKMDMGDQAGDYTMLTTDDVPVCGIVDTDTPQMADVPPNWSVYLSVDDVDKRVDQSVSLGATLVVPAMSVPTVGRMALIQDPQGAHVWFFRGDKA